MIHQVPPDLAAAIREIIRHQQDLGRLDRMRRENDDGAVDGVLFLFMPIDIAHRTDAAVNVALDVSDHRGGSQLNVGLLEQAA